MRVGLITVGGEVELLWSKTNERGPQLPGGEFGT